MGKKVIVCCNVYPPAFVGGAELIAHQQAKKLKKLGYDVIVFAGDTRPRGPRHSVKKETYDDLTVFRVYLTPEDYQPQNVNFSHGDVEESFGSLLDNYRPDVAHFHNLIGLSAGLIHVAKQRGIKTVLTLHDHWGICHKNTLLRNDGSICVNYDDCRTCMPYIHEGGRGIPIRMRKDFLALQFQDVDVFISPSSYLADAYIKAGFPKEKFHVVWNGVNVEKFAKIVKNPRKDKVRFTFIGYFGKHKGIQVLIDALPLIYKNAKFTVNLVGAGELTDRIMELAKEKGLKGHIKFWGRIDNIEDAYRETDVLVLPSVWPENQPVSITEAMAARTPVIASRIGGIPELVDDGRTGLLFEAGDPGDLARAMSEFISRPDIVEKMGGNAYDKISGDTLEAQVNKILGLYGEKAAVESTHHRAETLIVCQGKKVDPILYGHILDFLRNKTAYHFVMVDWLPGDQATKAKLLWVVDRGADEKDISIGLTNKVPLLVPEKNQALRNLCLRSNCGLYYDDFLTASECLRFLTGNINASNKMGENGFRYYEKSRPMKHDGAE